MHKRWVLMIVLAFLGLPVFAGYFDLAISLGTNTHLFEKQLDASRMKLGWGVCIGLTDTIEFDIQAGTELVPTFIGDTSVAFLLQKALLGQRSTGSRIAGVGVNTLLGAGFVVSPHTEDGTMGVSHLVVSITPLTIGSPVTGKRERLLGFSLAYNLWTDQVSLYFDLLTYDLYAVGTYRDYL